MAVIGGTEEGWQAWIAPRGASTAAAAEANWTKPNKPLLDFALADLEGRTWRLADLKGRVTFVNVWATSCGPCRAELPYVEKLYQQMKGGQDVLVLTLNTDENPALIEPFLRQNKYTFPVLPALLLPPAPGPHRSDAAEPGGGSRRRAAQQIGGLWLQR